MRTKKKLKKSLMKLQKKRRKKLKIHQMKKIQMKKRKTIKKKKLQKRTDNLILQNYKSRNYSITFCFSFLFRLVLEQVCFLLF